MSTRKQIGVGVVGFGWMGMAHSRSMRKIPMHFPERGFDPRLVIISDTVPARLSYGRELPPVSTGQPA